MKTCTACREEKPLSAFHRDRKWHHSACKECRSAQRRAEYAEDPQPHRDRIKAIREADPLLTKRYREANREAVRERTQKWRANNPNHDKQYRDANPEREKLRARRYHEANPEVAAANAAKRRAAKRRAVMPWADNALIRDIYTYARIMREAGVTCEVDHVVPLGGKDVCGLHVAANLTVLLMRDNRSKGNKHHG